VPDDGAGVWISEHPEQSSRQRHRSVLLSLAALDAEYAVGPAMITSLESGCEITVVGGRTINTGNYNSVKISVALKIPAEKDNLDSAYDFATNWVSKKLNEAVGSVPENGN
jgi:hypothetical protein